MNGGGNQGGAVPDEVDRLIEAGLEQYGQGDVNGALMAWERALAIDPDDVRASAYVDYVRENYEVLAGTPRADQVPLGLGSPALDDDAYEIELSSPGRPPTEPPSSAQDVPLELAAEPLVAAAAVPRNLADPVEMDTGAVERYIESVDEGWFLDDEPMAPGNAAVTTSPATVTDPPRRPSAPPRQLPLPANPGETQDEITLELEADEPDPSEERPLELELAPPGAAHGEEERTSAFRNVAWHTSADLDFGDQRSAVPTQEIAAPRGFVRARVEPLATEPEPPPSFETEDDRLLTRPGRSAGGPLEGGAIPHGVAPEALAALGPSHQGRRADPDELTRESPFVRVTFNPDTQDLTPPPAEVTVPRSQRETLDLEPPADADDERTSERSAIRADTSTEKTTERAFAGRSYTRPEPLDEATGVPSGRHPPLVIIDDPVLAGGPEPVPEPEPDAGPPPAHVDFGHELGNDGTPSRRRPSSDRHRAPTADPAIAPPLRHDDLSPGTHRMRRPSAVAPSLAPTVTIAAIDEISRKIDREVEADTDPAEARADRTRRRVTALIDRAVSASAVGNHADAIVALDLALSEEPDSAIAQKLLHRHQPAIHDIYQRFLGDLGRCPHLAMPMHELSGEKLDIRAAFLLSRIDGNLSFEEILDVSGMQRGEAFRHLSNLILRGILTVA